MAVVKVLSEVPGTVWKIETRAGDQVVDGDVLLILESMKMEIPVQATSAGKVVEILVSEGDFVGDGDAIVTLESG